MVRAGGPSSAKGRGAGFAGGGTGKRRRKDRSKNDWGGCAVGNSVAQGRTHKRLGNLKFWVDLSGKSPSYFQPDFGRAI